MGMPRPPRPPECALEFVSVSPGDMASGARFGMNGEYEQIGMVTVGADEGTDALSEEVRQLVRPRACAMGGEVLSLMASGTGSNRGGHAQQNIVFTVWAHRASQPATPEPF